MASSFQVSRLQAFLQNNAILPFYWTGSGFIEKDHRLIVTGDLRIVRHKKLRKLFTRYRESHNISLEKSKSTITEGLNDCIHAWSSKYGIDKAVLFITFFINYFYDLTLNKEYVI